VDFAAIASPVTDTLDGDVRLVVERLQRAGFDQMIVVDLSQPEYDFAVVRVIIPDAEYKGEGMRHRFGKRAKEQTLRALVKRYFF
jgi:ribosomal protein S12 methylthiotransferase accessory factor YcaO